MLACAVGLQADLKYDMTERHTFFTPYGTLSHVLGAEEGVYDIPTDLYAPPMGNVHQAIFQIQIKGNKLSIVGQQSWKIFDLDAATLTTIDTHSSSYSVDSLASAYARYARQAGSGYGADLHYEVVSHKTGKSAQIDGQNAAEYQIVAVTRWHGRPKVAESVVCWIADGSPSTELDLFREKWAAQTKLPFPDNTVTVLDDLSVYGAVMKEMDKIGGHIISFVTENRPPERVPMFNETAGYDASHEAVSPMNAYGQTPSLLNQILATQITLSNFSADPVPDSAFIVPPAFKQKKAPGARR